MFAKNYLDEPQDTDLNEKSVKQFKEFKEDNEKAQWNSS